MTATVEPGSHPRREQRRPRSRRHTAADQREVFVGELGFDLDHRHLVDRHHVREGPETGHGVERGAVAARRARVHHDGVGVLAQVRLVAQAEPAVPARGDERPDDPVTDLEAAHLAADPVDDARALVAEDRRRGHRERPVDHREVRVTDAAGGDPDDDVAGAGRVRGHVLDDEGLVVLDEDGCAHGDPSLFRAQVSGSGFRLRSWPRDGSAPGRFRRRRPPSPIFRRRPSTCRSSGADLRVWASGAAGDRGPACPPTRRADRGCRRWRTACGRRRRRSSSSS